MVHYPVGILVIQACDGLMGVVISKLQRQRDFLGLRSAMNVDSALKSEDLRFKARPSATVARAGTGT